MKDETGRPPSSLHLLPLLSSLWLHEPNVETIVPAEAELGLPAAEPGELAQAYADLFLLNVPPYGTAFTDERGELNTPAADRVAAMFEAHGYAPPELNEVGAPDHLGLWLGFLSHRNPHPRPFSQGEKGVSPPPLGEGSGVRAGGEAGGEGDPFSWAPVCCLAVERDPSAHPFYLALARRTREHLLGQLQTLQPPASTRQPPSPDLSKQEELRLSDLVRFFLTPARSGVFLSRARLGRMARRLGLRLPFGSRWEVAESLFGGAGQAERLGGLIEAIEAEVEAWEEAYRAWGSDHPAWGGEADRWMDRTRAARDVLGAMREVMGQPIEAEYGTADD